MASNPNVNKVVYGNDTLIDLTEDTVTADKILQGYTAHDRSGAGITGTYVAPATPTDITPSNTTPPALSIDVPVNPKDTGHAIKSYTNTTPTLDGVYFPSGFNKMGISGYAYSEEPEVKDYEVAQRNTDSTTTSVTLSGMSGKRLLVLLFTFSTSGSFSYTRFDNATITGGTLTKVTNLMTINAYAVGTYFLLDITSDTCVVSTPNSINMRFLALEAIGGVVPAQQQVKTGTFTTNTTSADGYKVTLGFKPKYVSAIRDTGGAYGVTYNSDISTTKYFRTLSGASAWRDFENSGSYVAIKSIDNDGFTVYTPGTYATIQLYYFAIGS